MGNIRYQVSVKDGKEVIEEIHKIIVYRFNVNDTDDPEFYAAEPIMEWEKSEAGKFVMNNAIEPPLFHKSIDYEKFGYRFAITAELEQKKLSEFYLRWGKPQ